MQYHPLLLPDKKCVQHSLKTSLFGPSDYTIHTYSSYSTTKKKKKSNIKWLVGDGGDIFLLIA